MGAMNRYVRYNLVKKKKNTKKERVKENDCILSKLGTEIQHETIFLAF